MTLTIEIDGPKNNCLSFRPLQRSLRGRYDFNRDSEPYSRQAAAEFPNGIPGLRVGYDSDKKVGFVEESLHDDDNEPIREIIERKGFKLLPAREEFPAADATTWLWWLSMAVKSGVARITEGTLPTKLDETAVQKNFIVTEPPRVDRVAEAIENQNVLLQKLLEKFVTEK